MGASLGSGHQFHRILGLGPHSWFVSYKAAMEAQPFLPTKPYKHLS